ncbi:MAG: outer membrane protein assembly factor BamA [Pseudomonadota bacterium]
MLFLGLFLFIGSNLFMPVAAQADEKGKVAVLPFRIHALQPLDHLKKGLQEIFTTRIAEKGLPVVSPELVNRQAMNYAPLSELKDIFAVGKSLDAAWVIAGSLTQVGKKISLDLKTVDITAKKPPFSIFMIEEDLDRLTDAADRAVVSLYNQMMGVAQIDSIGVAGNRRIESEAVIAVVESKKGESLDPEKLDKDLRAVFQMGFFKDVSVRTEDGPKGKIVIFDVLEKPSISKIAFTGNKKFGDKDLEKEIGIRTFSILNQNEVRQSINRLKEFYRQKGYYDVSIQDKIEPLPKNEISLIYQIDEGGKIYITKIEFQGNAKFTDDDLKDLMETSEKGLLSLITNSGFLDKKKLEFDLHKIEAFYHNHGYIKAKTGAPEIAHEKGQGLKITVEIVEGDQYTVNQVNVEGDLIKPADDLMKEIHINQEKFYNREVVRKDTLGLRSVYGDEGYAYAEVSPIIKENDQTHQVDITYRLSKGEKVRFERINISGNTRTRDKVIRRELQVIEGEYFTGAGIQKGTKNLHRLGFFEDIEVQNKKGSRDDLMVLDIKVKEQPTGSFSMGAGYSSYESALGTFQISENNLFGYGQRLMGGVKLSGKTTQFDIRFTEPWFMDKPISAGIDLYNGEREYDDYIKNSYGAGLRFGFPILSFDEFTRGLISYTYDITDVSDVRDDAAVGLREMVGENTTSSMEFGIKRDSRDHPWNTTTGSVNSLTFEYAGGILAGDVYFNKYMATTQWFFPLPWKTVFLTAGRWGYVEERSGGKLPIYQKFRLGGIDTVRGFESYTISPTDPDTGDRIGGEKMMVYNLEYRFPLVKDQGIVGLVFFDAGNVFTQDESFSFSGIRRTAGGGIRWYSPVGPLRIEYGRNLDQREGEDSSNIEFAVGGSF